MTITTYDKIDRIEGALVQHGPLNQRVYLMKMPNIPVGPVLREITKLVRKNKYSKIFAKIPNRFKDDFVHAGFAVEAEIPHFFKGVDNGLFMGRYFTSARSIPSDVPRLEEIKELALSKAESTGRPLDQAYSIRPCTVNDVTRMVEIYREIFPTYPFPISDSDYILQTMLNDETLYFGVEFEGTLVALGSAEMDKHASAVEMTDFATLPDHRGHSIASHLLVRMEDAMIKQGFYTAFTIARAISPGMNITFAKAGYAYGGRLVNNTNISGQIESMNVWYKPLTS